MSSLRFEQALVEASGAVASAAGGQRGQGARGDGLIKAVRTDDQSSGTLSSSLLADMASLRERQGQYLALVAGKVQA